MLNKLINKILGTGSESWLASFIQEELNKPLLAHPTFVESYCRAFLSNTIKFDSGDYSSNGSSVPVQYISESNTLVLHIDGALVSKEMEVPCAKSPVSYDAIRHELYEAVNRDDVDNIVARFSSGGGVASRNSDISDFIYEMRKSNKRMIAVTDDAAYSAAFSIYSAFPERVVSRSGGLGSVGVVLRHQDNSEYNKDKGISVTYLYKGDKKIFGNPDEPLSSDAKSEIQSEIDDLYGLFVETVARNLNISVQSVIDTQAGTFMGQKAIDIGFADRIGTLESVLEDLRLTKIKGDTMSEQTEGFTNANEASTKDVVAMVKAEFEAEQALKEQALAEARKALEAEIAEKEYVAAVTNLCKMSGISESTTTSIINSKMSIVDVKSMLAELTTDHGSVSTHQAEKLKSNDIAASWDRVLSKR